MSALVAALMVPIILLNAVGGLIGGVWMLTLGEWELVVAGILWAMCAPLFLGFLLIPAVLTLAAGAGAGGIGRFFTGIVGSLWFGALMVGTTVFIFHGLAAVAYRDSHAIGPFVLLAYGASVSPWAFMAQKGRSTPSADADWSFVPLLGLQMAAIGIAIAVIAYWPLTHLELALVGAAIFAIVVLPLLFVVMFATRRPYA